MSEYTPDTWVVLKIGIGGHATYKVLAGWGGGYTYGASWKLNSGITEIREEGNYFLFNGYSGSVYHCNKKCYGLSAYTAGILEHFREQLKDQPGAYIDLLPEETNFMEIDYVGSQAAV
jgi:hypothetical protein